MAIIRAKFSEEEFIMSREKEFDFNDENLAGYQKDYSEEGFWDKITGNLSGIGLKLIYKALQLYYVAKSPYCPLKIKAAIYGALAYLIMPIDVVPDFIPVVGYSDDGAAIATALVLAQYYINDEIKEQAKEKLRGFFSDELVAAL